MKILIQYESDTLLTEEVAQYFKECQENILKCKYEPDKIIVFINRLRNQLIQWLDRNKIVATSLNDLIEILMKGI